MNVIGIIAEFNPFHNGHKYLLDTVRHSYDADYIIVVMSGNFTQRGEPAVYDKFVRTRWALLCGADLVLELPVTAAAASAGDFAMTGVSMLAASGIVTHLAFGCEDASLHALSSMAQLICEEPLAYKSALKQALKSGQSWPAARAAAVDACLCPRPQSQTGDGSGQVFNEAHTLNAGLILKQPNNILAMEYLTAIKKIGSAIKPLPIQRISAGYHDKTLSLKLCSATALRSAMADGISPEKYMYHFPLQIREDMAKILSQCPPMMPDDFSGQLICRLLTLSPEMMCQYADVDAFLAARIANMRSQYTGVQSFIRLLKHRAYTQSRISRALCHLLLDIKKEDQQLLARENYSPYLRILGFRQASTPLLSELKKHSQAPLISKLADAGQRISPEQHCLLQKDIFASDVYQTAQNIRTGTCGIQEYRQKIIRI